jgi:ADP-heptose:LPS heptosyltransferase
VPFLFAIAGSLVIRTMIAEKLKHILISRTDSLGDVVLTLPLAGYLKSLYPNLKISFLGSSYAQPLVACCEHVDNFVDYTALQTQSLASQTEQIKRLQLDAVLHVFPVPAIAYLMKQAGVPLRIGTSHRIFHWLTCNRLVSFSRKRSELHESQLNFKLLEGLGLNVVLDLQEISSLYGLQPKASVPDGLSSQLDQRFKLILHPKSKGSAREWSFERFEQLAHLLPEDRFQLLVSGSAQESVLLQPMVQKLGSRVLDVSGKLSLAEFIALIGACDGLVAASTGPLHIAAALGKKALGLYAPMKPIHPGRWKPLGAQADYLVHDKECSECRKGGLCACILGIEAREVLERINHHI